ncbi:hypothetical protein BX666DRAFT_631340 [Dichotomocladium elegans]|nr:hypothetical protein BX666DRAFT_631340 [Dichotomocladium elegans]
MDLYSNYYDLNHQSIYRSDVFTAHGVDEFQVSSSESSDQSSSASSYSCPSLPTSTSTKSSITSTIFPDFDFPFACAEEYKQQIFCSPYLPFFQDVLPIRPPNIKSRVPCNECRKSFTRKADLKRHKREVHEGGFKKYDCVYNCGSTFMRKHDRNRHSRSCKSSNP